MASFWWYLCHMLDFTGVERPFCSFRSTPKRRLQKLISWDGRHSAQPNKTGECGFFVWDTCVTLAFVHLGGVRMTGCSDLAIMVLWNKCPLSEGKLILEIYIPFFSTSMIVGGRVLNINGDVCDFIGSFLAHIRAT